MKILVSNDDGFLATGINVLTEALAEIADVVVVAPDRNRSAASNSLTVHSPLRISKIAENRYSVDGTPSDCVHLALTGLLDDEPDLVVSGINHGANLGDDVIYSGTVAAAMEGRFLDLPTLAVSLAVPTPLLSMRLRMAYPPAIPTTAATNPMINSMSSPFWFSPAPALYRGLDREKPCVIEIPRPSAHASKRRPPRARPCRGRRSG